MMQERIFARAVELAGEADQKKQDLLRILCVSGEDALARKLRSGITSADCGEAFVTAVGLYALADAAELDREAFEFRAGDLTVQQSGSWETVARSLRAQAEKLMSPYVKDRFLFTEV